MARFCVAVLAVAMIACSALAVQAQSAPRLGLCVSSTADVPALCDAVVDGVVDPSWSYGGDRLLPHIVQPDLWMSLDPQVGEATQAITIAYGIVGEPEASTAEWTVESDSVMLTADTPIDFKGELICRAVGVSNYTITLSMGGFDYDPVVIVFQKRCSQPYFDIGSFSAENNVMAANVVSPTYAAYILTPDTISTFFWVYLSAQQDDPDLDVQPFTLEVVSQEPDILQVDPAGDDWDGYAMPVTLGGGWTVGAVFTCLESPDVAVDIPVTAELKNYGWSTSMFVKFFYRCGQSLSLKGMQVGTTVGASDVAVDGVAVAPWNTTYHYAPDETYVFTLFLQSNDVADVPYTVNVISQDANTLVVTATSATSGTMIHRNGKAEPVAFRADIICQQDGRTRTLLQVSMGAYNPVQVRFMFTCIQPLFNIGIKPQGMEIIKRGEFNSEWGDGYMNTPLAEVPLYVQLDKTNTLPQHSYTITVKGDPAVSNPAVFDTQGGVAKQDDARAADKPAFLRFNCIPCLPTKETQFDVTFHWGWVDPITVSFRKQCVRDAAACDHKPTPDDGGDGGSGGGMSGAGVAALVIFLLSFFFCVAGCVYNRQVLRKSGWHVVPGAITAAQCVDSFRTGGRANKWSPQENESVYAAAAGESGAISPSGAGYQSYSSNL